MLEYTVSTDTSWDNYRRHHRRTAPDGAPASGKRTHPLAKQFQAPPLEFRGAPFWVWNDRLNKAALVRQIDWFLEMGMGGFFIHPRTGLDTEYLGKEFMDCVAASADRAAALGLRAWLYDEDRWPSGYAGGLITQEPTCRERYLLFTPRPYGPVPPVVTLPLESPVTRNERGRLLARYQVKLVDGYLAGYRRLAESEPVPADGVVWYAYLEVQIPCGGWNNATLGDVLNPETTRRFLAVTHERYAAAVGRHFGGVVPGIFTDEPHFVCKYRLARAADATDLVLPFTDDLPDTYRRAYGDDLLDHLPEVVWDLPGHAPSSTRYRYHDHLCNRLVDGFLKPISGWCAQHHVAFTGHLVEESLLESQVAMNGDVMRGYPHLDIPGMDLVGDGLEFNTAKQCQSVVRQLGKPGMLSELYGASGWDFSFADFKAQGDWQAALGVTLRVHHLAWSSMQGQSKRDYPGSIFHQQPWWREFRMIEDHFARLNTLLTRGRPRVRVGVIHPVESYWLGYGPADTSGPESAVREKQFRELTEWLLFGLVDFDFIAESLLPEFCPAESGTGKLRVGQMEYETILVPNLRTIRSSTLERLERFASGGGRLIFLGEPPTSVDARPFADRIQSGRCLLWDRQTILDALAPSRLFQTNAPPTGLLHQLREEDGRLTLFVCNTDRQQGREQICFRFPGHWQVTEWDTISGETRDVSARADGDATTWEWSFPPHGHLLVTLEPASVAPPRTPQVTWHSRVPLDVSLPAVVPVTLSEPNSLPLDLARWRWNDEAWQPREEILRIEDAVRQRLGLPLRRSHNPQPWCDRTPTPTLGRLTLEFDIVCGCPIDAPRLALETLNRWRLTMDGQPLALEDTGWWVDEAIRTVSLPALVAGNHRLSLQTDFTRTSAIEWAHLLGDFSVTSTTPEATLAAPVKELRWGDWTTQGLPFYTGNVTYHLPLELVREEMLHLRISAFANPVIRVAVDDRDAGLVAFAPFECPLGNLSAGLHALRLTAFGTRNNSFGCLHRPGPNNRMSGTDDWHTTGAQWDYVRHVSPKGILRAPIIEPQ